ncbi:MAG: zf-HC2 domain-containing protein [Elusimicrobiota bacterium]
MSLLPDCREMSRRLSEASDTGRALSLSERIHLWICDVCRRLLFQLALVGRGARRAPEGGPALSPEAKARLRRALGGSSPA